MGSQVADDRVTPKGDWVLMSEVTEADVSISHRTRRVIFDGNNAGNKFKAVAQLRADYADHPEWPLINKFPNDEVTYEPNLDELRECCKDLCVLPDFWKFNVLKLGVTKRHESWKLDFAKSGNLATNFLPHGAAAVVRDTKGILRFPVWGMYQLHGDLGERLGLTAKRTRAQFNALMAMQTSEAHGTMWCLGDVCPANYQFPRQWDVLGELPPRKKPKTQGVFQPQGFTAVNRSSTKVLPSAASHSERTGQESPLASRATKQDIAEINQALSATPSPVVSIPYKSRFKPSKGVTPIHPRAETPSPRSISPITPAHRSSDTENLRTTSLPLPPSNTTDSVKERPPGNVSPLPPPGNLSLPPPGDVSGLPSNLSDDLDRSLLLPKSTGYGRFPKTLIPRDNSVNEIATLQLRITQLTLDNSKLVSEHAARAEEVKNLEETIGYADEKIRELVKFASYGDNVVAFIAHQFGRWKDDYTSRSQIEENINTAIQSQDKAVTILSDRFPDLEALVAEHIPGHLKQTACLDQWLQSRDHIGFSRDTDNAKNDWTKLLTKKFDNYDLSQSY